MKLLGFIETPRGRIDVGDSWDNALLRLELGRRSSLTRTDEDCWVEVREFDGQPCELTWERGTRSPYVLVRIRQSRPVVAP